MAHPSLTLDLPTWVGKVGLIVFVVSGIGLLCTLYMKRRNYRVCQFRISLIRTVSLAMQMDAEIGNDGSWRMEAMHAVSYDQMLNKFWKPLSVLSFYDDDSWLMPPHLPDEATDE